MAFYLPHCLDASYNATELADLKDTSQEIASAIFEGRNVSDGWANAHLARHMDFLARWELALETLLCHLDKEMECRGYAEPYQLAAYPNQTCYECVNEIGWALECVRGKWGYAASWLLSQLLFRQPLPPTHTWGGIKG